MNCNKCLIQFLLLFVLCNCAIAQIPVMKESHHKPVLVNDYIRLLDVHLNSGDTTLYHIHAVPSVIVHISKSMIGAQIMGQTVPPSEEVLPGQTRYVDYEKNPVAHRVYNGGSNIFHVMDIELVKKNPSPDSCAALQQSNVETTINEKLVRVYKFDLNAHQLFNISKSSCAHLLICISGIVNTGNKKIATGEYGFFNPKTAIEINNQNDNSTCVLLELK
jgi:hypothetical protein